jgi:hypothetical protein
LRSPEWSGEVDADPDDAVKDLGRRGRRWQGQAGLDAIKRMGQTGQQNKRKRALNGNSSGGSPERIPNHTRIRGHVRIPDPFHSYSLTAIHSPVFVIYNQAPRFDVVGGSLVGRRLTNRAGGVVVVTSGVSKAKYLWRVSPAFTKPLSLLRFNIRIIVVNGNITH